jgi:hypothetical protein
MRRSITEKPGNEGERLLGPKQVQTAAGEGLHAKHVEHERLSVIMYGRRVLYAALADASASTWKRMRSSREFRRWRSAISGSLLNIH